MAPLRVAEIEDRFKWGLEGGKSEGERGLGAIGMAA